MLAGLHNSSRVILSPSRNSIVAAIGYSAWAMFANSEHATSVWLKAGITQAITSFALTMIITLFARWLYHRFGGGYGGIVGSFLVSFVAVTTMSYSAHWLSGTPDIWQTITPSMIIGSGYKLVYLLALKRSLKSA